MEKRNYEVEWKTKPAMGCPFYDGVAVVAATDADDASARAVRLVCRRNGYYPGEITIVQVRAQAEAGR